MSDSTTNGQGSPLDPQNFGTVQDFWRFIETHPETVQHLDATSVIELALTVGKCAHLRERDGSETANNDATKREENGIPRDDLDDDDGPPSQRNGAYKVGPGKPPIEHQFTKGNPGGPGRTRGPKSMRRLIREAIYNEMNNAQYARSITSALLIQAINGNTHAIRLVCENGNNRRKNTKPRLPRTNPRVSDQPN